MSSCFAGCTRFVRMICGDKDAPERATSQEELLASFGQAGNLAYPVKQSDLAAASLLVEKVHDNHRIEDLLHSKWPVWPTTDEQNKERSLVVFYTDFEPDDIMSIAQIWQLKSETRRLEGEPFVIFAADFENKDGGTVYDKKLLMAALMLGLTKYHVLTPVGDIGKMQSERDGTIHPQNLHLASRRQEELNNICASLKSYNGSCIELYIMAPGHGNLGAIVQNLKHSGCWPLPHGPQWKVQMYSGSFNMRGMQEADLEGLRDIMTCSKEPLVDVGKFPFFGGTECDEVTDSLTTFAHPKYAKELYKANPLLAGLLVLFNDEFNEGLINPQSKSLFKGSTLDESEKEAFDKISEHFRHGDRKGVEAYARALVADQRLFAKVANFKKSTLKAFAFGGCDSPLCDQLLFLREYLHLHHPDFLAGDVGKWHYDKARGITQIKYDGSGEFDAVQPIIRKPLQKDQKALIKMRHVLSSYILKHLCAVQCHVERVAGHLQYSVEETCMSKLDHMVDEVRRGRSVDTVIQDFVPNYAPYVFEEKGDMLPFFYTDLEPDDAMAVAQLWQWRMRPTSTNKPSQPLLVFHADFQDKDCGTIFEKKELITALLVGFPKYYTLTHEGDDGQKKCDRDEKVHPRAKALADSRNQILDEICDRLKYFGGELIELSIISPAKGNLGAIVRRLKEKKAWPLKAKWRVSMYSGSFNMRGMQDEDIQALKDIMACADSPLVDVGKFPFFGGKDCHPWTDSLTTFVIPGFANSLSSRWPELAAVMKTFNDEFNEELINPGKKSLFKGSTLDADEQKRFEEIKKLFKPGDRHAVQAYAQALLNDAKVFAKVAAFKHSTVKAFAYGGCDFPLCDQLLFLYEWLKVEKEDWLEMPQGTWHYDKDKGFTTLMAGGNGGFQAIQPRLAKPKDEMALMAMRMMLESMLLQHLRELGWAPGRAGDHSRKSTSSLGSISPSRGSSIC